MIRSLCEAWAPRFTFFAGRLAVELFSAEGCIIFLHLFSLAFSYSLGGVESQWLARLVTFYTLTVLETQVFVYRTYALSLTKS